MIDLISGTQVFERAIIYQQGGNQAVLVYLHVL